MADVLATNWWALALRGVAAIVFALLTFAAPGITVEVLVLFFGAYAIIDGILAIISAVRAAQGHRRWLAFLLEGIAGLAAGALTFFVPGVTVVVLVYLIAAWAIITGIAEIAAAVHLRRHVPGEWLLWVIGIVSILFGISLYIAPIAGAIVIAWWIGAYALVFGILFLILAFRLRSSGPRALAQNRI